MTYNTKPRRRFSKKQRQAIFDAHGGTCYWCREPIMPGQPWAIEHLTAREMLRPDQDPDGDWNLDIIHDHPAACHKEKTKLDRAQIKKSNHIRKHHGLDPVTKKSRPKKINSRGFGTQHRPLKSRNTFDDQRKRRNPRPER